MSTLNVMWSNYWTTVVGAALAGLYYLDQIGTKMPSNGGEWLHVGVGLGLAVLGFVAKSATTGSVPYSARVLLGALLLGGCASATPISANPLQDVKPALANLLPGGALSIDAGLKEAAYNFDGAVSVGIKDPRILEAQACVHGVMKQLGLEADQVSAPSFVPQTKTVIGVGAVLFIRAIQAAGATGQGVLVP